MNLKEVIESQAPELDFAQYRQSTTHMPSLKWDKVSIDGLWEDQRNQFPEAAFNGQGSFFLRYKGKPGRFLSLEEIDNNPEKWNITQLQGINSKAAYRVNTGLNASSALGSLIKKTASNVETTVRQVQMPLFHEIEGIDGVAFNRVETVMMAYTDFAQAVGMQISKEDACYIADFSTSGWV